MRKLNLTLYDQTICRKLCYQDYVIKSCNCYDEKYPSLETNNKCNTKKELVCLLKIENEFLNISYKNSCGYDCPIECDRIDRLESITF